LLLLVLFGLQLTCPETTFFFSSGVSATAAGFFILLGLGFFTGGILIYAYY